MVNINGCIVSEDVFNKKVMIILDGDVPDKILGIGDDVDFFDGMFF